MWEYSGSTWPIVRKVTKWESDQPNLGSLEWNSRTEKLKFWKFVSSVKGGASQTKMGTWPCKEESGKLYQINLTNGITNKLSAIIFTAAINSWKV